MSKVRDKAREPGQTRSRGDRIQSNDSETVSVSQLQTEIRERRDTNHTGLTDLARAWGLTLRAERYEVSNQVLRPRSYDPKGAEQKTSTALKYVLFMGEQYRDDRVRYHLRRLMEIGKDEISRDAQSLRSFVWAKNEPTLVQLLAAKDRLIHHYNIVKHEHDEGVNLELEEMYEVRK